MLWPTRWFKKGAGIAPSGKVPIFLTNTLSGDKEVFISHTRGTALLYSCGPTVYGPAHIGNLRSYVFSDTLTRVLKCGGYRVLRVINITDVGHLVGDGDEGEDKMAVGAEREKTSPEAIAKKYAELFIEDLEQLNIDTSDIRFPRATEYINEQIVLARTLEEKGFAYRLKHGLAFDTARFPGYGRLGNVDVAAQRAGARVDADKEKRHPADFWLWRSARPHDLQQWNSPWGRGNPGWHIECSAMIRALLGPEIDIHTGGEDHIAIHNNNEIAQSEAALGRPFVRYWMHNAFLTMDGEKAAKSLGNVVYLSDIMEHGYHPLALRYFFLQAHYRSPISFTWEALAAASAGLERLWALSRAVADESARAREASQSRTAFLAAMRDDLGTPQALAILWETLRSEEYSPEEKWGLIEDAEAHLGLKLTEPPASNTVAGADIPEDIARLLAKRATARDAKDFAEADRLRDELETRGYHVEDGPAGPVLTKRTL